MKQLFFLFVLVIAAFQNDSCTRDDTAIYVQVQTTDYVSHDVPICVDIDLPVEFMALPLDQIDVTMAPVNGSGEGIPGQVSVDDQDNYQLWWILPVTDKVQPTKWKATFQVVDKPAIPVFHWQDDAGKHMDLYYDDKKVFRYEYELDSQMIGGDPLTRKNKVFYHIYDLNGDHFITNGYQGGVYPHHRGIMIGWRNVGNGDRELSFWGMEDKTSQKHIEFVQKSAGPVLAIVEAVIHWDDSTGTTLIEEHRKATIFHLDSPVILSLDFSSTLKAVNGSVLLDGNAEHAGVQYRAHNDVAAGAPGSSKAVYYFHNDTIDPTTDYNLPWVGMSYGLNNKTYSVVDMNGAGNPTPAIWSAYRDYGRYGPFIRKELGQNESFTLQYRYWVSESEMPERNVINGLYSAYRQPPLLLVQ